MATVAAWQNQLIEDWSSLKGWPIKRNIADNFLSRKQAHRFLEVTDTESLQSETVTLFDRTPSLRTEDWQKKEPERLTGWW